MPWPIRLPESVPPLHRLVGRRATANVHGGKEVAAWEGPTWSSRGCRASLNGGLYPGKVSAELGAAYIPFDGKEVPVHEYEVLMVAGEWEPTLGGKISLNASPWGYEANGPKLLLREPEYVVEYIRERPVEN